jgi:hypothetical protein
MLLSMSVIRPQIRRLSIERFRGIESLIWRPDAGVNVILGGGDTGVALHLTCRPQFLYFQQLACCTKPVDVALNL